VQHLRQLVRRLVPGQGATSLRRAFRANRLHQRVTARRVYETGQGPEKGRLPLVGIDSDLPVRAQDNRGQFASVLANKPAALDRPQTRKAALGHWRQGSPDSLRVLHGQRHRTIGAVGGLAPCSRLALGGSDIDGRFCFHWFWSFRCSLEISCWPDDWLSPLGVLGGAGFSVQGKAEVEETVTPASLVMRPRCQGGVNGRTAISATERRAERLVATRMCLPSDCRLTTLERGTVGHLEALL
jgi:hypothetical protein